MTASLGLANDLQQVELAFTTDDHAGEEIGQRHFANRQRIRIQAQVDLAR
jgi:hypothetical protein